jgi:prepilin-type processing-associated H-X9-DG protein
MSQSPYDLGNVAPRRGLSGWTIALIVMGGCGVIVVLIVGILLAIFLPVFNSARKAGQRTSCMSNMKQISLGMLMYMQDYDERMPPANAWGTGVYPYIKNNLVFACPTRRGIPFGYAFNVKLDRRKLSTVKNPALTPMLFESSLGYQNAADPLTSFMTPHANRSNLAYVDGHVKSVSAPPSPAAGLGAK